MGPLLLYWHWANYTIVPAKAKQHRRICVNESNEFSNNCKHDQTKIKQSQTRPYVYYMLYTVSLLHVLLPNLGHFWAVPWATAVGSTRKADWLVDATWYHVVPTKHSDLRVAVSMWAWVNIVLVSCPWPRMIVCCAKIVNAYLILCLFIWNSILYMATCNAIEPPYHVFSFWWNYFEFIIHFMSLIWRLYMILYDYGRDSEWINPLWYRKCWKIAKYVWIFCHFATLIWCRLLNFFLVQDKGLFILHDQCHGYWRPVAPFTNMV